MVDFISDDFADIIEDLGELGSFTRVLEGTYDPTTGTQASGTTTTYTAYVCPGNYKIQEIDNTVVLSTDIKLTMEVISTIPLVGDIVSVNSKVYRIISIKPVRAQGSTMIYILQCRI